MSVPKATFSPRICIRDAFFHARSRNASPVKLRMQRVRAGVALHADKVDEIAAAIRDRVDIGFPVRQPGARVHAEHDAGAALLESGCTSWRSSASDP